MIILLANFCQLCFHAKHTINLMSSNFLSFLWYMALLTFDFAHIRLIWVRHLINLILHRQTIFQGQGLNNRSDGLQLRHRALSLSTIYVSTGTCTKIDHSEDLKNGLAAHKIVTNLVSKCCSHSSSWLPHQCFT